jgi:hypothetical protein
MARANKRVDLATMRYENDGGSPINLIPGWGDKGDRYRTNAVRVGYGDFYLQLNMYTGDPRTGTIDDTRSSDYLNGFYKGGNVDRFRLGALTFGHLPSGMRIGLNSEGIRHTFQNQIVHNNIGVPAFKVLNNDWAFYYYWGTNNRYSLWY